MSRSDQYLDIPLLRMHRISKNFPGVTALDRVEFDLYRGEVHAVVGENGAGKSTLMKILSGVYQPDGGEILIDEKPVRMKNPQQAEDRGIRIIYQEFTLIPQLSAAANIFLGHETTRFPGLLEQDRMFRKTSGILRELGLEIDPAVPVRQLNVAQQQMVEIAKGLLGNSRIFIMDEPTSALNSQEITLLFDLIRNLKQKGVGIIYITHRLEELFRIADRITVLRDGKSVGIYPVSQVDKGQLIRLMANRDVKDYYPRIRPQPGEPLLEVSGLRQDRFFRDIHFKLCRGEILGIAGLLGAGRTELARAIFGIESPQGGEIRMRGVKKEFRSPRQAIKAGIGFLTEDRKQLGLVLQLSVKDNISLPNLDQQSSWGVVYSARQKKQCDKFVEDLRIKTPGLEQKVLYLSGGNQQKVVLSKWLARHLDILIFDEPTRGIDVAAKVEIYQLMNQLTAQGVGIIMISSELPEILGMSDRILVMHEGEITGEFDAASASQEMILARALGEAV